MIGLMCLKELIYFNKTNIYICIYIYICNYFYDLTQKVVNCNDSAIVSDKGKNNRIYFWYMSKVEDINEKFWFKRKKWIIQKI